MSLERLRCHLRRIPLPAHLGSDLESFTVDEVMGELSEFVEEAADYNERVHREEEEEQYDSLFCFWQL